MTRLAWFTPLPPERSGISAYSAELLPALAGRFAIDVYADLPSAFRPAGVAVFDAYDFVWKHQRQPYDLTVYQLGNATCHDYMWPYLFRFPGLVVLHDGQLHFARARLLLQQKRYSDYRAEFKFNHPDARPELADLGISGLLGSLHYFWPMLRTVVDASRGVAVHSVGLANELREEFPGAWIERIRMGVPEMTQTLEPEVIRARHAIPRDGVVFAAFGRVTPEKRISQILGALAALAESAPPIYFVLVGDPASYYDAMAEAETLGVANRVKLAGFVADSELASYLACTDVCLCMRWPTARETSASWLRCLAAGKPTVVTELSHPADVPALITRGTWTPSTETAPPVCISIDILDEDNSLRIAMRRLATDATLRARLGGHARAYWRSHHAMECMTEDYVRVLEAVPEPPSPRRGLPAHLRPTGTELTLELLRELECRRDPFESVQYNL